MTDVYEIPDSYKEKAWVNDDQYREMYRESIENPESIINKPTFILPK